MTATAATRALPPLALLALAACYHPASEAVEEGHELLEEFAMTQSRDGKPAWRLEAPEGKLTFAGKAELRRPRVQFYRDGRPASNLEAREARLDASSRDIALEGDVVIRSPEEKMTLRTSRLDYLAKREVFVSDAPVEVDRPGARIRGKGLEADSTLSEIRIRQQVTTLR